MQHAAEGFWPLQGATTSPVLQMHLPALCSLVVHHAQAALLLGGLASSNMRVWDVDNAPSPDTISCGTLHNASIHSGVSLAPVSWLDYILCAAWPMMQHAHSSLWHAAWILPPFPPSSPFPLSCVPPHGELAFCQNSSWASVVKLHSGIRRLNAFAAQESILWEVLCAFSIISTADSAD